MAAPDNFSVPRIRYPSQKSKELDHEQYLGIEINTKVSLYCFPKYLTITSGYLQAAMCSILWPNHLD